MTYQSNDYLLSAKSKNNSSSGSECEQGLFQGKVKLPRVCYGRSSLVCMHVL